MIKAPPIPQPRTQISSLIDTPNKSSVPSYQKCTDNNDVVNDVRTEETTENTDIAGDAPNEDQIIVRSQPTTTIVSADSVDTDELNVDQQSSDSTATDNPQSLTVEKSKPKARTRVRKPNVKPPIAPRRPERR